MNRGELFDIYLKEREYQTKTFGEYEFNQNLNVASFLTFIEESLNKAKKTYVEKWDSELPPWLNHCKETIVGGNISAPVKTYEYLIKIYALAGAALEAYTNINPDQWRENLEVNPKWEDEKHGR